MFEPVEAALHAGGLTGNPKTLSEIGRTFPENFYDQDLIDRAISQASRLKIPIPPPESQNEKYNVRPAPGEDLGLVTLFIIAFNLFSHSIKAIYLTYLLFLATSVLLFWCAFRRDHAYISILMLLCAVIYVLFVSPLFPGDPNILGPISAWTTPVSGHFLSTLGFVPMLHILAVCCRRPNATLVQVLCLGAQAVILYLVFRMRFSAIWMIGPISCGALIALLRSEHAGSMLPATPANRNEHLQLGPASEPSSLGRLMGRLLQPACRYWPALLVMLVAASAHFTFQSQLHPLYREGSNLTRHAIGPEMYYGLQAHPEWATKYGGMHQINGRIATGDDVPIAAVNRYLDEHPEIDRTKLLDPVGNIYWGVIEYYSMLALWDFVWNDPWFVVESLGHQLTALVAILHSSTRWILGSLSAPEVLLLVLLALCAICALATASRQERSSLASYVAILCLCVPASWMPNLVSIVGWEVMADAIVAWLFLLLVLPVYLASAVARSSFQSKSASYMLRFPAQMKWPLGARCETRRRERVEAAVSRGRVT